MLSVKCDFCKECKISFVACKEGVSNIFCNICEKRMIAREIYNIDELLALELKACAECNLALFEKEQFLCENYCSDCVYCSNCIDSHENYDCPDLEEDDYYDDDED